MAGPRRLRLLVCRALLRGFIADFSPCHPGNTGPGWRACNLYCPDNLAELKARAGSL